MRVGACAVVDEILRKSGEREGVGEGKAGQPELLHTATLTPRGDARGGDCEER